MKKSIYLKILLVIFAIVGFTTLYYSYNYYEDKQIEENNVQSEEINNMFSMFIKNGTDENGYAKYDEMTTGTWPTGVTLNTTLSKCYDSNLNPIALSTLNLSFRSQKISMNLTKTGIKCYLYFDK